MLSFVISCVVLLNGCSSAPSVDMDALASDPSVAVPVASVPDAPLAFVAPTPNVLSAASSEGNRVSYRLAPGLPVSTPITETRVAVMPESLASIDVWVAPSPFADRLITFDRFDEFLQPRVFRILAGHGDYYEVQVPMRPNESTGYILRDDVDVVTTNQRLLIDLSDRSVIVWDGDDVVMNTTGTIGQNHVTHAHGQLLRPERVRVGRRLDLRTVRDSAVRLFRGDRPDQRR